MTGDFARYDRCAADTRLTSSAADTRPFAPFEWLLALRYLRARRKEGFISVIASFSFLGILLGVATLIIVMAVMNGFRKELFAKILGLDGHVVVIRTDTADFPDYQDYAKRLEAARRRQERGPADRGPGHRLRRPQSGRGSKVRGMNEEGLKALPQISKNIKAGTLEGFDGQEGIAVGIGLARLLGGVSVGDTITLISPRGAQHAVRRRAAHQGLQDCGDLRDGHVGVRPQHHLHAARRGAALLRQGRCRRRARGARRRSGERREGGGRDGERGHSLAALRRPGGSATPASSRCSRSSAT